MAALTAFYADRLRRAGYRVIEPMDEDDWRRCLASELQRLGYRVFAPLPPPKVGSIWIPTRGRAKLRGVLSVTDRNVTYEHLTEHGGTISVHAWHVWRQRTRARPPAALRLT